MSEEEGLKHEYTIVVEATEHQWLEDYITYEGVVGLEFPDYAEHPDITYSVKYQRGHGNKPEGILVKGGEPIRVKNGMVFNVSPTGQS